jgi:hypothetical protein
LSNDQLKFLALAALAIHVVALTAALLRRRSGIAPLVNLPVGVLMLIALTVDLKWLRAPIDLQVVGLAVFEVLVVVAALMALRRHRAAIIGSWVAFALHLLANGLAVAFILTFKITRLI